MTNFSLKNGEDLPTYDTNKHLIMDQYCFQATFTSSSPISKMHFSVSGPFLYPENQREEMNRKKKNKTRHCKTCIVHS